MNAPLPGFVPLAYLSAAILFIVGLKRLSSPASARSGNLIAAGGMALAVVATLLTPGLEHRGLILTALSLGAVAGFVGARRVLMTDMPQMVALLNGLGGGAAALVSTVEFVHASRQFYPHHGVPLPGLLGTVIGAVSFSGSLIAFGKLQGIVSDRAIAGGILRILNAALAAVLLLAGGVLLGGGAAGWYWGLLAAALVFGSTMVLPIGGADMPVVISLLNSCTGLAAAATGFTLDNTALIISGTLVGASGTLLTQLMCKAMNRSLANVLFSGFGAGAPAAAAAGASGARPVREIGTADAAVLLANIRSLIIVPGYGMAVAQAQHVVRELADLLAERGVDVKYAIHPVAGRMPGHMNVLLAEANVPYTQLFDLDQINDQFERADVALVIGANDVVNPSARTERTSPIYGMPILDADKAQHTIVIKRGMSPGFAGIDNPLYYEPKTLMLFGDAKGAVTKLVGELKAQAA
ncbi:MAG TPA: NAD(P)(+) transhydrogenase (Re/Si-specific) subunit beta [Candidatus Saccharimonadaceae bacterium]|nr:NAD(P)(+) transhydrogenase (Re/Si-specific) subunit beta [Candidatus Saccharimonadaceae bacterium]